MLWNLVARTAKPLKGRASVDIPDMAIEANVCTFVYTGLKLRKKGCSSLLKMHQVRISLSR